MALPRGGVPIGIEVSRILSLPLEVLVIRKIGAPSNPEFGVGAVTEGGYFWVDQESVAYIRATKEQIQNIVSRESEEVKRRTQLYRHGRARRSVRGTTVILVDDGLATGVTARVAARYLKTQGAKRVILAVPVAPIESIARVTSDIDEVICLETPTEFNCVADYYSNFDQVPDNEVVKILTYSESDHNRP